MEVVKVATSDPLMEVAEEAEAEAEVGDVEAVVEEAVEEEVDDEVVEVEVEDDTVGEEEDDEVVEEVEVEVVDDAEEVEDNAVGGEDDELEGVEEVVEEELEKDVPGRILGRPVVEAQDHDGERDVLNCGVRTSRVRSCQEILGGRPGPRRPWRKPKTGASGISSS